MQIRLSDIIRKGCIALALVLPIMMKGSSCLAQNRDRLPDSISTAVDSLAPETVAAPAVETQTSTSSDASGSGSGSSDASSASSSGNSSGSSGSASDSSHKEPADTPSLRQVPDTTILAYKRNKDFVYANDPGWWGRGRTASGKSGGGHKNTAGDKDKQSDTDDDDNNGPFARLFSSGLFKIILYLVLGGLLLFALYKIIIDNNLHLFYRAPRKVADGRDPEDGADLNEEDLEKKIREALLAGDHRTAVRYLFLKTLRMLNDRQLIAYHLQATNQDYINQMAARPQGANFLFLTNAYEYIWYGDFPLTADQFGQVEKRFQDFYKSITHR